MAICRVSLATIAISMVIRIRWAWNQLSRWRRIVGGIVDGNVAFL